MRQGAGMHPALFFFHNYSSCICNSVFVFVYVKSKTIRLLKSKKIIINV